MRHIPTQCYVDVESLDLAQGLMIRVLLSES